VWSKVSIILLGNNSALMEFVAERLRDEARFAVLGIADSPSQAVEMAAGPEDIDLAVIDLDVMNGCCAGFVRRLRALRPRCRVILLSCASEQSQLASTLDMRADALVLKSELADTLGLAVREAMAGGVWFPESVRDRIIVDSAGPSL
jgi:DNA-binding NarL/FixJ family response regulator